MKTVFITGCSTGIGRNLALEFKSRGFKVFASARNIDSIKDLSDDNVEIIECDVTDKRSIYNAYEFVKSKTPVLNYLMNNAGYAAMGPVIELPDDDLNRQFNTNVLSQILVTKAFLPLMINNNSCIVNMSSVSGDLTTPFAGAYCATKAAFTSLSDALRMELKPLGVKVITVKPGAIQSNFGKTADKNVRSWFKKDSIYFSITDAVIARANASQDKPMPTSIFTKRLADKLLKKNPPANIRLGKGAIFLLILGRWIPLAITDKILSAKFGLNKMVGEIKQ